MSDDIAERLRSMAGWELATEEDMIEALQAMLALIEAEQMTFFDHAEAFAEAGVHTAYPAATTQAADGMGSVADQLRERIDILIRMLEAKRLRERRQQNGGQGPKPDWVQPDARSLHRIDPRQVQTDVWRYQRGEQG